jgi:hypothetical protein
MEIQIMEETPWGKNMVEKSDIETCFSELQWIKDKDLRDKVVQVWIEAADRGKWKTLDDVPFTLLFEDSSVYSSF